MVLSERHEKAQRKAPVFLNVASGCIHTCRSESAIHLPASTFRLNAGLRRDD